MTGIPGTRRLVPRDDTLQARMWAWMRSRRKPWTVADLTGATGASGRAARRYVERLAQAAYLASLDVPDDADGEDSRLREGGAYVARRWHLARDTGPRAPILVGGSGGDTVADGNGGMTGTALAALRREMGLSLAAFGCQVIDVRDARTVRRYERMDRVPTIVVDRIAAWRARPGVAQR